jgi:hypothetical protein
MLLVAPGWSGAKVRMTRDPFFISTPHLAKFIKNCIYSSENVKQILLVF